MRPCKIICYLVIALFIAGCAAKVEKALEKPVEKPKFPLVLISPENFPPFNDDLNWESLDAAIGKSLKYYDAVAENITSLTAPTQTILNRKR
jgi:PBP1b-binding outer membrane lipoprotein LpoB